MVKKILKNNVLILLSIGFLIFCFGYTKAYNPYQVNKHYFVFPSEMKISFYSFGENVSVSVVDQNIKTLINKINSKEINSISLIDQYFRNIKTKYVSEDGFVPFEVKIANRLSQNNIFFAGANQEVPLEIKWYGSSPEVTLTRRLTGQKIQIGNFRKKADNNWYVDMKCTHAGAWDVLISAKNPNASYAYSLYCMPYNVSLSGEAKPDLYIESIEKISEFPGVITRDGTYAHNHPDMACMDECGNIYDTLKNKETNSGKKCSERVYNTVSFNNKIAVNRICVKNVGDLPAAKVSLGLSYDNYEYATYNPGLKEWYGSDPGECICEEKKEKEILAEAERLTNKEMDMWIKDGAPSAVLDPAGFANAFTARKQEVMDYNLNRLGFNSASGACCDAGFGLPETAFKTHVINICNKSWCGKTPSQLNARNNYCIVAEQLVKLKDIYDSMSDRIKKSENYSRYKSETDYYLREVRLGFEEILVQVFNSSPITMDFNFIGNKNVTVGEMDRKLVVLNHKLNTMAPSAGYEVASAAGLGSFSSGEPIKTRIIDWIHTMPFNEKMDTKLWNLALDNLIVGQHFKLEGGASGEGYSEWTQVDISNYESPCDSRQINSECFWYRMAFNDKKIEIINPGQTKCINVATYMQPYVGSNGITWEFGSEMEKKLCKYKSSTGKCVEADYTRKDTNLMLNISVDPYNNIPEKNDTNNSALNYKNVNVVRAPNEKESYQYYSSPDLQSHNIKVVQDVPENYANPPKNMLKWFRGRLVSGSGLFVQNNYPYIGKDIRPMDEQCKGLINRMKAGSVINSGGGIWSASGWYGF